jgi:type VI secretion system protein ImpG
LEVYSVNRVSATSPEGEEVEYLPFYSAKHADLSADRKTFWYAARRPRRLSEGGPPGVGTDVFLTLIDLDFSPSAPADWTLHVETTCVNRGASQGAIFRDEKLPFQLSGARGPISDIVCLVPPTPTRYPEPQKLLQWRLISHLSLNYLSLDLKSNNVNALQEVLRLYDVLASADTRDIIDAVAELECRRGVARAGGAAGGLCRGLEVNLVLDEKKFAGSGPYLFASVLSHFFGLYISMNSYARLRATTLKQREKGESWTWPPRAGEKQLL